MSWGSSRYAPCSKTPRSTAVHFSISLLKSSRMRSRSRCWAIARRSSTASRLCRMQLLVELLLLLLLLLLLQRQRQLQRQPRYRSRLSRYPRLCRWKRRVVRPSSVTALSVRRSNERRARAIYRHPARGPLAEASSFRRRPARLAVESAHHAAGLVAVAVVLRAAAVALLSHDHRRDSRSLVHRSNSSLLKAPCNGRHKRRSKSLQHNNHHPPSLRRLRSRKISRTFRFASISRPSWSTSCCDITVRLLSHATHRLVQCAA